MTNSHILTVRDLIEAYSGDIIFIRSESGHKMYFGFSFMTDKRLQLCSVSKFCFSQIEGYFTLLVTIKEVKGNDYMTEFRVKDVIDYCYNDFVKIIDRVTEYDGAIKDVPYRLINRRVIGISVIAEKEYVKLVIKI